MVDVETVDGFDVEYELEYECDDARDHYFDYFDHFVTTDFERGVLLRFGRSVGYCC